MIVIEHMLRMGGPSVHSYMAEGESTGLHHETCLTCETNTLRARNPHLLFWRPRSATLRGAGPGRVFRGIHSLC
jgi:hypothetical protein